MRFTHKFQRPKLPINIRMGINCDMNAVIRIISIFNPLIVIAVWWDISSVRQVLPGAKGLLRVHQKQHSRQRTVQDVYPGMRHVATTPLQRYFCVLQLQIKIFSIFCCLKATRHRNCRWHLMSVQVHKYLSTFYSLFKLSSTVLQTFLMFLLVNF